MLPPLLEPLDPALRGADLTAFVGADDAPMASAFGTLLKETINTRAGHRALQLAGVTLEPTHASAEAAHWQRQTWGWSVQFRIRGIEWSPDGSTVDRLIEVTTFPGVIPRFTRSDDIILSGEELTPVLSAKPSELLSRALAPQLAYLTGNNKGLRWHLHRQDRSLDEIARLCLGRKYGTRPLGASLLKGLEAWREMLARDARRPRTLLERIDALHGTAHPSADALLRLRAPSRSLRRRSRSFLIPARPQPRGSGTHTFRRCPAR